MCKERLDLFEYHSERAYAISNDAAAIKAWLDGIAGRLKLALEIGELRPWEPMIPGQQRCWQLLKRRAALVRCKVQLNQCLNGLGLLQEDAEALVQQCEQMIRKLDRALLKQAQELGWAEWIERCQGISGVGPLTAMALVASWQRGQFRSVDAFVAFLGLGVRVEQSGRWQGLQADAVLPAVATARNEQYRRPGGPESQADQGQLHSAAERYPIRPGGTRNRLRLDIESIHRVDGMRVVPFDFRSMVQLLSSSLGSVATFLPLLHAEVNLENILQALVKVLERVPFAH